MTETKELVPIEGEYRVVKPLVTPDEALKQWNEYQKLVERVIDKATDVQTFPEDGVTKAFIKKSGWQKLATYYGISVSMVDERLFHKHDPATCLRAIAGDKFADVKDCGCPMVGARYVVRASAPNGRTVEAVGLATFNERRAKYVRVEHDLAGKAYTRAVNRAIAAMVGAGQVSAEEKADEFDADRLTPDQVRAYEELWKGASEDRKRAVFDYLAAHEYKTGEFRRRGGEDYETVIALLTGGEAMP